MYTYQNQWIIYNYVIKGNFTWLSNQNGVKIVAFIAFDSWFDQFKSSDLGNKPIVEKLTTSCPLLLYLNVQVDPYLHYGERRLLSQVVEVAELKRDTGLMRRSRRRLSGHQPELREESGYTNNSVRETQGGKGGERWRELLMDCTGRVGDWKRYS